MFPNSQFLAATALLSALPAALAQTFTDCNPLNSTSCPSNTALGTAATFNWTDTAANNRIWNASNGVVNYTPNGAQFTITGKKQSPTIQSLFYIFWGRVSVTMKAAPGVGVVSSVVLESEDLDEIDWEWIGGNTTHVQTNFFGKGDTTTYDRAQWHPVDNTLSEHNYTVVWVQQQMDFYVDGNKIRTIAYDDPVAQSKNTTNSQPGDRYPQTPMAIRLGNWVGGDPTSNSPGTVEWAGGQVDYSKAPFTQTITSLEVEDFTKGSLYTYGDMTGSWQSIKVASGNSTIADILSKPQGVQNRFKALPKAAQIAIVAGSISIAAILVVLLAFCCVKNRRAGRKERALADAEWERNQNELQQYKRMMAAEEEIHPRAGYI